MNKLLLLTTTSFLLGFSSLSLANQCIEPKLDNMQAFQNWKKEWYDIVRKAAYSAMIVDECGFDNQIETQVVNFTKRHNLHKSWLESFKTQKNDTRNKTRVVQLKWLCYGETGKSRSTVNDTSTEFKEYENRYAKVLQQHENNKRQWQSCLRTEERQIAKDVSFSWHESSTYYRYILRLYNPNTKEAKFNLRCHDGYSYTKNFNLIISPRNSREIGHSQGWEGNFRSGDYCHIIYNNETLGTIRR